MLPIIGTVVDGIIGLYRDRQEAKAVKEAAHAKLQQNRQETEDKLSLSDAEWEALAVSKLDTSWKDEYVTIVITSPLILIMLGGVLLSFTGDSRLIEGANLGIVNLNKAGVDMGMLMNAVVLAAIGLKFWRGR